MDRNFSMLNIKSSDLRREFSNTQFSAPAKIAEEVQNWGKEKIPDDKVYNDPNDPSFGRETDTHVTVKFGLHTNNPDEVAEVVKGFGEFEVNLGKVSKFSSEKYDVLKIDVNSEKLHALNKLISDNSI